MLWCKGCYTIGLLVVGRFSWLVQPADNIGFLLALKLVFLLFNQSTTKKNQNLTNNLAKKPITKQSLSLWDQIYTSFDQYTFKKLNHQYTFSVFIIVITFSVFMLFNVFLNTKLILQNMYQNELNKISYDYIFSYT